MTMHENAVVQVTDLIGRPGASRRADLVLPTPAGISEALVEFGADVTFEGVIESVVDGLLVRGNVRAPARVTCARCLKPTETTLTTDVAELFAEPDGSTAGGEDEGPEPGYEIVDGRIDLDPLLRDALAPAMPYRPLCTPDCRGLCANCGADLNETTCGCADAPADSRWSVLERLELPDTQ